ncbi:MAG: hypothetical protein LAQ69_50250 [Acidobacteriia bacterium]|nr:hypothetical protein [Terriglobia bacterium]
MTFGDAGWLGQLYRDFRYGARGLRRNPAFTAMAALSLALGIGANTAIFSIFNGLFLGSLPYPDPQRLVFLSEALPGRNIKDIKVAFGDFEIWHKDATMFDRMALFYRGEWLGQARGGLPLANYALLEPTLDLSPILRQTVKSQNSLNGDFGS